MTLRWLTAGESHGKALVGILEGYPAGVEIDLSLLKNELLRRKKGYGRGARQDIEKEEVEILSGVRHGKTLGSPISILLKNNDFENWSEIMSVASLKEPYDNSVAVPRPGHADLPGAIKYNHQDVRNVLERASARETAIRVAIGVFAKKLLKELNISIFSRVIQVGNVQDISKPREWWSEKYFSLIESSDLRCLNKDIESLWKQNIDQAKKDGDSLGGVFEVVVTGLPIGLGSYVHWDRRLDGNIAQALMSLNAIKGVEIGDGFDLSRAKGSEAHDEILIDNKKIKHKTNRAGGLVGGVTNGEDLIVKAAMKPLSTLLKPLDSISLSTGAKAKAHVERTDTCAVPSAAVISEALLALVLANEVLIKFGGDSISEIISRIKNWNKQVHIGDLT